MFIHFLLAMLPIIWLIIALSGLKMAGHVACPIALIITAVEALFLWKQKIIDVLTGGLEGFAMAIWPICLVIVAAVFTYNLVVHTKNMELIKKMLTSVSKDKRILVLIISWGFGGFMEGMAGFGTAVAIPAGILCGLGFDPIFAAMICLVANTTPVAFGSIGIPTVTAANVTGFSPHMTASYVVLQLAIMVILVPFFLVFITGKHEGAKGLGDYKEILFITLMSGVSFLLPQYLTAKFIGAELPAVIGSVCSMAVTIILAKVMLKGKSSKFDVEIEEKEDERSLTVKDALVAWSPFILVLVFLLLTSTLVPAIHDPLSAIKSNVPIYTGEGATPYTFTWVATPGVLILIAAFIGGIIQKCPIGEIFGVLGKTIVQMLKTIITIMAVLATAKIMGYSGMTQSIADFIVRVTGSFYPLVAPLIGSIGTFVTGSSTSSSVLFSKLQASTGAELNINQIWLVAANTVGSTAGKIISPQSIAVATAATATVGKESEILTKVIKYFVLFAVIYGLVCYFGLRLI
ncbi:MAG: L-lactate permease [Anaerostipes sp.]